MSTEPLTPGQLLVAVPRLVDPNFRRAVVLLLHADQLGALGVVLNRPLDVPAAAVLPGWDEVLSAPDVIFGGGPVGLDGALAVATLRAGAPAPPAVTRVGGPFGIVDLDAPPERAVGVLGMRAFAGHAGWGAGQLEAEVAAGDWYVLPALPADVTTAAPRGLWRMVLRRQGGALAFVSAFPEDPSLN